MMKRKRNAEMGHTDDVTTHADALAGNGALFAREDCLEAAWAVVDPVLERHHPVQPYECGSWGPEQADTLVAPGRWHNPGPEGSA